MAISIGTIAQSTFAGGGQSTDTLSCTQPAGTGGYLIVVTTCDSSTTAVSSVTYNGVAMTQVDSTRTFTTAAEKVQTWQLANPSTGANNIVVTYGSAMFNPTSIVGYPITGSAGTGVFGFTDTGSSPQTNAITVSANSIIIAICPASGTNNPPSRVATIDGTAETSDFDHALNNFVYGAHSVALSSGSRTTSATSDGLVGVFNIEVKIATSSKMTQAVWL